MKYIFTAALGLFLLAGCKKVDEQQSREEILRGGAWSLRSASATVYDPQIGHDTTFQIYADIPACVKDNSLQFLSGHIGQENLGSNLCSSGAGDLPFEWELYNNDENIRIYNADESFDGNDAIDAELLTLTSNRFVIRYKEIDEIPEMNTADTVTYAMIYGR